MTNLIYVRAYVPVSAPAHYANARVYARVRNNCVTLLVALLMRWRLIPQHPPCCSSSRRWSVHDVGLVATADSSEISNSVPDARSFAGHAHSARQSAAFSCPMAVACVQAENAARDSCGAQKQRVYGRCKRSVTGMPNAGQRIKRNREGECEGESAPSSLALWMAAST